MVHRKAFDETGVYADRADAGRALGAELARMLWQRPVVYGLARGGVPVAAQVATALAAPIRVCVARKIGAPGQPELALGAVTAEGPATFDSRLLRAFDLASDNLHDRVEAERAEARRREDSYRMPEPIDVTGRDVIIVDDGLATGATARAAVRSMREAGPARVVLAVPVGAPEAVEALDREADLVVCPRSPAAFSAVGQWYRDFRPTTDEEIRTLLAGSTSE